MPVYRWPDPTPVPALDRYPLMARASLTGIPADGPIAALTTEPIYAGAGATDAEAIDAAERIAQRIGEIRQSFTGKLGLYGVLPWDHTSWGFTASYETKWGARWRARNDLLAAKLLPLVDFLAPDCYVKDTNVRGSIDLTLTEAKRINGVKPIYPFIWHRRWSGSATGTNESLSWNDYRQVLLSARRHASGCIVYCDARTDGTEDQAGHWTHQLEAYANGWQL